MNCDKCKNKPWKECCIEHCKQLEYCCYICKNIVKVKNYIKHLGDHYDNPDQYLECIMCKVCKHIYFFRIRNGRCRLCIYLNRYRFGHNIGEARDYALGV